MMVVLHTEAVPEHVRGYCSRFLVETSPGLFVGTCSPVVAENLWSRVREGVGAGTATFIRSAHGSELGYVIDTHGSRAPEIADFDGLELVVRRQAAQNAGQSD